MIKRTLKKICLCTVLIILVFPVFIKATFPHVLSLEKRAQVMDEWLKLRLKNVLPKVMEREKIDMWLVLCREYNEDPVFLTLVPARWFAARRLTILVFNNKGNGEIERLSISRYDIGEMYKGVWKKEKHKHNQWECLARIVKERNPKQIGINVSEHFAFGDGLTASLRDKLALSLGKNLSSRLCSAERLAIGWLEKRILREIEVYHHIVAIAHSVISEAFSDKVITPGVTTAEEVEWWMRKRVSDLNLKLWFHPWVDIQRNDKGKTNFSRQGVIKRGDVLHCDLGITYLGLNTDTQEMAYILREGETEIPQGLKQGMKEGNLLQDILTQEFKRGRTGNQILLSALKEAKSQGLDAAIYTHPLGFHGHAAGPTIGLWDQQQGVPVQGDYPLYYDTCYAIELNVKKRIPEWGNQVVRIALEQDALYDKKEVTYLDGRQKEFHIVK
jgi:hypothetical protein